MLVRLGSGERLEGPHLVQNVLVEVGHVPLAGHRAIVIISEVLLQGHRVVRDVQDGVQVVGQHLRQRAVCLPEPQPKLGQRAAPTSSLVPTPILAESSAYIIQFNHN